MHLGGQVNNTTQTPDTLWITMTCWINKTATAWKAYYDIGDLSCGWIKESQATRSHGYRASHGVPTHRFGWVEP